LSHLDLLDGGDLVGNLCGGIGVRPKSLTLPLVTGARDVDFSEARLADLSASMSFEANRFSPPSLMVAR